MVLQFPVQPSQRSLPVPHDDGLPPALAGREKSEQLRLLILAYANARLRNIIGSNSSAG